ncbi:MAG: hypothetical protein DCC68_25325 [Planctomycetota bacterium]|nr:MAG: hypothetical protein DCC68_25325 [Planctomycetota bacterium]
MDTDAVAADWFNAASMVLALAISDASVLVNLVRKEVASIDELKLPPLDETPSAWPEVTPSELARLLGISLPKLRERTDNGGDIRVEKITQRRYKIHPDDLNRVRVTAVERERTKAMIQEARRASSN